MSDDVLPWLPKTPSQELRFEIFQRAAQRYEWARALRTGGMLAVAAVAVSVAAYSIMAGPAQTLNSTPMMCAISAFASLATLMNAWLIKAQRDGYWRSYCEYLNRTGRDTNLELPPV